MGPRIDLRYSSSRQATRGLCSGWGAGVAHPSRYPSTRMLDVRYDPVTRIGYVKLRPGRVTRTRELSEQATGEYDVRDRLVAITVNDLDDTAAEFLRTADEDTLLAVIRAQAGRRKAGRTAPPAASGAKRSEKRPAAKPRARANPAARAKPATPSADGAADAGSPPKRRRRRRPRKPAGGPAPTAE